MMTDLEILGSEWKEGYNGHYYLTRNGHGWIIRVQPVGSLWLLYADGFMDTWDVQYLFRSLEEVRDYLPAYLQQVDEMEENARQGGSSHN